MNPQILMIELPESNNIPSGSSSFSTVGLIFLFPLLELGKES